MDDAPFGDRDDQGVALYAPLQFSWTQTRQDIITFTCGSDSDSGLCVPAIVDLVAIRAGLSVYLDQSEHSLPQDVVPHGGHVVIRKRLHEASPRFSPSSLVPVLTRRLIQDDWTVARLRFTGSKIGDIVALIIQELAEAGFGRVSVAQPQ